MTLTERSRKLLLGAACCLLLGCGGNSVAHTPSTITFGIGKGARKQFVAPGDTIKFVTDNSYKKSVLVKFKDKTPMPCRTGPISECTVPTDFPVSPTSYSFSLCLDQNCNVLDTHKGDVVVQDSRTANFTVYIALSKGGDINHFAFQGDTIAWVCPDDPTKNQPIKFTYLEFVGFLNPCSDNKTGAHQTGPCKVDRSLLNLFQSFTYDCDNSDGSSCSDPIVHMVRQPPENIWDQFGPVLAAILGLLFGGFLIRTFWRR